MNVAAIVPAAGRGIRLKSKKAKAFVSLRGVPLVIHAIRRLQRAYAFSEILVPCRPAEILRFRKCLRRYRLRNVRAVAGGRTRAESVYRGLRAAGRKASWILVHDAARPLPSRRLVRSVLREARRTGAALAALPATATVKRRRARTRWVQATEDRDALYLAQTPQAFRRDLLEKRYASLGAKAFGRTDEAALFDGTATRVRLVEGEALNLKITTPEDLKLAAYYLKRFS